MPKSEVHFEIHRCPMISDNNGGYTLYDPYEPHQGPKWEFIDVSVLKYENDCLVDEVESVDNIPTVLQSSKAINRFIQQYPEAHFEDHLEHLEHHGPEGSNL